LINRASIRDLQLLGYRDREESVQACLCGALLDRFHAAKPEMIRSRTDLALASGSDDVA